jgi:hypothetical protein
VGLFLLPGADDVLAHADALAAFRDGCCGEPVALVEVARKEGKPARLVRVAGGQVAHLPLWDDLMRA